VGRGPSIENRKNAEDSRRGKLFTKLIREVTVAARGGADPSGNPRLRMAVDKALSANMPKDTIERAIKRGSGAIEGAHLEEVRYEGYGPGGVAILVECMTDNRTRTVGEVRHAFSKHGGNLGADGSVAYLFHRLGVLGFETQDAASAEKILERALDAAAEDVVTAGGWTEVLTQPEAFDAVKKALAASGLAPKQADITWRPKTPTDVTDPAQAEAVAKLIEVLDELDDVQNVYTNAHLPGAAQAAA
jgi:YebC/PmpR family DNA-binding regulatory protein